MPIIVEHLEGGRGVILTGQGTVTGEDFRESNAEIFSGRTHAEPLLYGLFDANGMTRLEVSTEDLRAIANRNIDAASRSSPDVILGVYANSNHAYGLARIWMVFVEESGWTVNVFRERSEAVAWVKSEAADRFGLAISLN